MSLLYVRVACDTWAVQWIASSGLIYCIEYFVAIRQLIYGWGFVIVL